MPLLGLRDRWEGHPPGRASQETCPGKLTRFSARGGRAENESNCPTQPPAGRDEAGAFGLSPSVFWLRPMNTDGVLD